MPVSARIILDRPVSFSDFYRENSKYSTHSHNSVWRSGKYAPPRGTAHPEQISAKEWLFDNGDFSEYKRVASQLKHNERARVAHKPHNAREHNAQRSARSRAL
jgi:hypothetical protein